MRTRRLFKSLSVVTVALAAVTAAPREVGALPNDGILDPPGQLRFHDSGDADEPVAVVPLPHDELFPTCDEALPTPVLNMPTSGTNLSGAWSAATATPMKGLFRTISFDAYQVDITILAASGWYSTTLVGPPFGYSHAMGSSGPNHIVLQLKFYLQGGSHPYDCVKTDLECTMNTKVLALPGGGSGFNGTLPGAGGYETAKLVFTSDHAQGLALTPVGACDTKLSSINGRHLSGEIWLTFP